MILKFNQTKLIYHFRWGEGCRVNGPESTRQVQSLLFSLSFIMIFIFGLLTRPSFAENKDLVLNSKVSENVAKPVLFSPLKIQSKTELKKWQKKITAMKKSSLKIWQTWQLSLQAIKWEESVLAENLLLKLVDEKQDLIAKDRIELNLGRLFFAKKDFQGAIDHYQKVSRGSDFWFEALEEEAWSYIRLNQPDKATSKLTTLLSPVFQNAVGPETYYAANYNALKICDYSTVFKNGKLFKERQQVRIRSLEALAKSGVQELLPQALAGMVAGKASYSDYGKEAAVLPRFFWRDSELQDIAHLIKSKTLSNNSETKINEIKNLEKKFSLKMQQMAQSELADYRRVIDKLQIIEAEVIQRLYLDPNLKAKRTEELVPPPTNADVLTFPHDEELWLDEIDSYQSRIKLCPQLKEVRI